jgi:hypothetical protein
MSQRAEPGFAGFVSRNGLCNTVPAYPYCGSVPILPNKTSSLKPRARLTYIQNSGPWRQLHDAGSACLRPSMGIPGKQCTPLGPQGPPPIHPAMSAMDSGHRVWNTAASAMDCGRRLLSPAFTAMECGGRDVKPVIPAMDCGYRFLNPCGAGHGRLKPLITHVDTALCER